MQETLIFSCASKKSYFLRPDEAETSESNRKTSHVGRKAFISLTNSFANSFITSCFLRRQEKKKKKEIFVQLVERCSKQLDSFKILSAIIPWKLSFEDPETSSYHYALIREYLVIFFFEMNFFWKFQILISIELN